MKVNSQVITLYLIQLWYNIFDIKKRVQHFYHKCRLLCCILAVGCIY